MKNIFLFTILVSTSYYASAQYTKILDFAAVQGSHPHGSLISDGTFLYGMTAFGGNNGKGDIFKIKPDGTGYFKLLDFIGPNGWAPGGSLISDGNFLYGMTTGDGSAYYGNIFKIKPDGTGFFTLHNFTNTGNGGQTPYGSLLYDGIFLYGMTPGTIFKIKSDGTGYLKLLDFTWGNGADAHGSLISDGTFLYGMTRYGGAGSCTPQSCGIIFKIKTDGTGYSALHDFSFADGSSPYGDLISDGTYLYGMTSSGGIGCVGNPNGCGVIFKIKLDGTGYVKLLDFNGTNGHSPAGSLMYDGTFLYGMSGAGGGIGGGNIFQIKADGTGYSNLFNFVDSIGYQPWGSLISDGTFLYGLTSVGGAGCPDPHNPSGCGVVFKYQFTPTSTAENNAEIDLKIYPNPCSGIFTVNLSSYQNAKISVYDVLGNCVLTKDCRNDESPKIDLSAHPKGIYFMEIVSDGERAVKKIVLQ